MERVFLGWDRPLIASTAERLADRYAESDRLDLRSIVAVLPGARAGKRLTESLLDEATRRGLRLVPPRTLTIGAFPELLYEPIRPLAGDLAARRAWSRALREIPAPEAAALLGELPGPRDTRGWDVAAAMVARLHREVAGGGHRFGDVAAICAEADELLYDDADRWRVLAAAQDTFERILAAAGLADRDLARITAARTSLSLSGDLWLIGVSEIPEIVKRMLSRCDGRIFCAVHAPSAEGDRFDEFGCPDPEAWSRATLPIKDEHLRVMDRPGDQAAAVLEEVGRLGEVRAGDVTIGVADDTLVPHIQERFHSAGAPIHWAGGVRAIRSSPYRLLSAVADYLEAADWESFAALARHPDLEPLLFTGGAENSLAGVDRYFAEHLPSDLSTSPPVGHPSRDITPAYRQLKNHLAGLAGRRVLSEWPGPITDFLIKVYGRSALSRQNPDARGTIAVLEQIRAVALALLNLPEPLGEESAAPAAIRLLLDELAEKVVPDEPEGASVEMVGWLEVALDDAPFVVVAGVNEPMLPESVNAHPFLPDRLRARLGIVDNARRAARDAFRTMALLHSRERVRFIMGRVTAEGDPLRPSRLMLALRGEDLARRVRVLVSSAGESGGPSPLVASAGARSHFQLPPVTPIEVPRIQEIAVTSFRSILEDPYRFVLEKLWRLESVHDDAREMDGAAFGSLAHRILGRWGLSPAVGSPDAAEIQRSLDAILDDEVARVFGGAAFPAVRLQIEALRARLHRFARWQAERAADGWEVMMVEGRPAGGHEEGGEIAHGDTHFDVDGDPVLLRGRIDRIDHQRSTGRWAILDYKTSDDPKTPEKAHRKKGAWLDLQLPLYRHLAANLRAADGSPLIPPGAPLDLGYILLSRDLEAPVAAMADWTEDEFREADETARGAIRLLRGGSVAFAGVRPARGEDPFAALLGARQLLAVAESDADDVTEGFE